MAPIDLISCLVSDELTTGRTLMMDERKNCREKSHFESSEAPERPQSGAVLMANDL
jgi:hypothetical protein